MSNKDNTYILCQGLFKIYKTLDVEVVALRGLELSVNLGEIIAIVGASGSGKSTLLNILAGYDTPSAGIVNVGDYDLLNMNENQSVFYRRKEIGFIWQDNTQNLFPYLSVIENIELPLIVSKFSKNERKIRSQNLLEMVGLKNRRDFKPFQLSGGEQQRVAIAVALSNSPKLLLADEPTGELDDNTSKEILELFNSVNKELNTTIVIVTHDPLISSSVDRAITIRDGKTSSEVIKNNNEFHLVDSSGHMQIPNQIIERLGRKVKFSNYKDGKVILESDE
ncbi:MAG: ABC transporter [Chloroflexi bacterium]|nr:ABC transporter [Chloroflexota bacterium]|tara:strand:+ start:33691 stop:34527 length:837 start_codon:yes stop_codon:yes gene_type:complete